MLGSSFPNRLELLVEVLPRSVGRTSSSTALTNRTNPSCLVARSRCRSSTRSRRRGGWIASRARGAAPSSRTGRSRDRSRRRPALLEFDETVDPLGDHDGFGVGHVHLRGCSATTTGSSRRSSPRRGRPRTARSDSSRTRNVLVGPVVLAAVSTSSHRSHVIVLALIVKSTVPIDDDLALLAAGDRDEVHIVRFVLVVAEDPLGDLVGEVDLEALAIHRSPESRDREPERVLVDTDLEEAALTDLLDERVVHVAVGVGAKTRVARSSSSHSSCDGLIVVVVRCRWARCAGAVVVDVVGGPSRASRLSRASERGDDMAHPVRGMPAPHRRWRSGERSSVLPDAGLDAGDRGRRGDERQEQGDPQQRA